MHFTRPGENLFITTKVVFLNLPGEDGYFLFFISRIATINNAMVKITMNSSYVLISIILSIRLGSDESTSPNYLGKYIIFTHYVYVRLVARSLRFKFCSQNCFFPSSSSAINSKSLSNTRTASTAA